MGYIFLSFALFAGALKGFCGKKTSGYTNSLQDAILANIIRTIVCAVIGLVLLVATGDLAALRPNGMLLFAAALSGVATATFVVTWLICVKKSAYMMLDIFLMLGVLIPLIASSVFFHEPIKLTQWLGIAVLLGAVVIMCSYNNAVKTKITPAAMILLLVCGVANGLADFSQKLFAKTMPEGSAAVFNFYTYIFAAVVLTVAFFLTHKADQPVRKADIQKIFGFIVIMAVCLFANSFFKTLAAGYLSAVLLYPLNQGCSLILSALMATALFKEKLTAKAVIGIATAFLALLMINLL